MSLPDRISPVRARWATLTAFAKFKLATDLEAEVDRLRAALREIRLHTEGQVTQYARAREQVVAIASAALDEEDPS